MNKILLKIMPNKYEDMEAVDDTIDYIYRLDKIPLPIFCYGSIQFPPDYTSLKNEYHQIRSYQAPEYVPERKLWHLIVSFDDPPANRTAFHYQYFDTVAALFRMEYQVCYSVHLDTDNLHSHCTKPLARRLASVTFFHHFFKKSSSFCIYVVLLSYHT